MVEIKRRPGERHKMYMALVDFINMGPGRRLIDLHHLYTERYRHHRADPAGHNKPPTKSYDTLRRWSARYDWGKRAEAYDLEIQALESAEREEQRQLRAARRAQAWEEYTDDALELAGAMIEKSKAMLAVPIAREEVGETEDGTTIVLRPTGKWSMGTAAQLMAQAEKLMETATGQPAESDAAVNVSIQNIQGGAGGIGEGIADDEQYDRAISALTDALRTILHQPGDQQGSAVVAGEPTAVDGDPNEGV